MLTLIVEDDSLQQDGIENILSESYPAMQFLKAADYTSAMRLIDAHDIQLFLLDIELDREHSAHDGIAIGEYIRSLPKYQTVPILFLTGLAAEAPRAIHMTNCFDYLVKPYEKEDLLDSVRKLFRNMLVDESLLELKDTDGVFFRIRPSRIAYVRSERHKMYLHAADSVHTVSSLKLGALLEMLPAYFVQCHKSYIVNPKKVLSYDKLNACIRLEMPDIPSIPVGRHYKNALERTLKNENLLY